MQDKLRAYNSRLHAAIRNGRGYDVAQRARGKFTHVVPVWYQVRGAEGNLELHGGHDLDASWLQSLRTSSDKVSLPSTSGHILLFVDGLCDFNQDFAVQSHEPLPGHSWMYGAIAWRVKGSSRDVLN